MLNLDFIFQFTNIIIFISVFVVIIYILNYIIKKLTK